VSSDNFVIVDTTGDARVIGETDFTSGPATLHPKAIYIVEGKLYQVERLDFEGRKAFVRAIDCDYYTDAITYTRVTVIDTFAEKKGTGVISTLDHVEDKQLTANQDGLEMTPVPFFAGQSHGEVQVFPVVGFKKIKFYTNETSAQASWICLSSRCTRLTATIPDGHGCAAIRVR
jgi:ATP-dependent helicase YprA (DUF1998 family)